MRAVVVCLWWRKINDYRVLSSCSRAICTLARVGDGDAATGYSCNTDHEDDLVPDLVEKLIFDSALAESFVTHN